MIMSYHWRKNNVQKCHISGRKYEICAISILNKFRYMNGEITLLSAVKYQSGKRYASS